MIKCCIIGLNLKTAKYMQMQGYSKRLSNDESSWTPVVGRRQKRRPVPNFVRHRFPPGHPIHHLSSDSDSGSDDLDLDTVIPTGANMDVQFTAIENTPGLTVKTRNTQSWTPIATRTRARLKK